MQVAADVYNCILATAFFYWIFFHYRIERKPLRWPNLIIAFVLFVVLHLMMNTVENQLLNNMFSLIMLVSVLLFAFEYTFPDAFMTAIISFLYMFIGELVDSFFILIPLKLTVDTYRSNIGYITLGNALMYVVTAILLRLTTNKVNAIRKRLLMKSPKMMTIVSAALLGVLAGGLALYYYYMIYHIDYVIAWKFKERFQSSMLILVFFSAVLLLVAAMFYMISQVLLNKQRYEKLESNLVHDEMTGALKRESGLKILEKKFDECKRLDRNMTICFVDVDNLKWVNDALGHKEGDRLISLVAQGIRTHVRTMDTLIRMGGDEFIVLFPECDQIQAEQVMKRIRTELGKQNYFEGLDVKLSFSMGFAEFSTVPHGSVASLIEIADSNMYAYKRENKQPAISGNAAKMLTVCDNNGLDQ